MSSGSNYAHLLRPIGQMLEALGVESFALRVEGDDFLVQGTKRPEPRTPRHEKSLRVVWRLLRGNQPESQADANPSSGMLEVRYTPEEIAQMEDTGRAKRTSSGPTPEPHALSQVLRAVGAFVDQKEGRLLGVKKHEQTVSIDYETALKKEVTEEFTVASLYDYWVKMYLKRRDRPT